MSCSTGVDDDGSPGPELDDSEDMVSVGLDCRDRAKGASGRLLMRRRSSCQTGRGTTNRSWEGTERNEQRSAASKHTRTKQVGTGVSQCMAIPGQTRRVMRPRAEFSDQLGDDDGCCGWMETCGLLASMWLPFSSGGMRQLTNSTVASAFIQPSRKKERWVRTESVRTCVWFMFSHIRTSVSFPVGSIRSFPSREFPSATLHYYLPQCYSLGQ